MIRGQISVVGQTLSDRLRETQKLHGVITICGSGSEYPHYDGEYIVEPKAWIEQYLSTKNKVMDDDVTVLEIPYAEVSNVHGTTVTIAS